MHFTDKTDVVTGLKVKINRETIPQGRSDSNTRSNQTTPYIRVYLYERTN